jgi:hypothetical protein
MRDRANPTIEETMTARKLKERRDIGDSFSGTRGKPGPSRLLGRPIVGSATAAVKYF